MTKPMKIEARDLTKSYGGPRVVDGLSFTVEPGRVTGFLGPNGAGKSTTMRLILGLDRPEHGSALIGGQAYRDLPRPLCAVGALLEAKAVHKNRSAYHHLLCLAQTQGLPRRRVEEVIDMVGLGSAARRRSGGFSLGMGQRLGIAAALLGDPRVLMLDEPVNGLDPEGIIWIRNLMKRLAAEGRTVLVSSHLMNEMAVTADHLVVIGKGRLIADCPVRELLDRGGPPAVRVRCTDAERLAERLRAEGAQVSGGDQPGTLNVIGMGAQRLAELAGQCRIVVYELTPQQRSLEQAFQDLTRGSVEYQSPDAEALAR